MFRLLPRCSGGLKPPFARVAGRPMVAGWVRMQSQYAYAKDFDSLSAKIDANLFVSKASTDEVVDAIKACQDLQNSIHDYDKFWQDPTNKKIANKIEEILLHKEIPFTKELLTRLFLLKLPLATNLAIIDAFYKRNPTAYIDRSIALIPFRHCLFNGDLQSALKLIDSTTGHHNYISARNDELKSGAFKLLATAVSMTLFSKVGIHQLIEHGILTDSWRHLGSINSMVLTYLLNLSFFVTIVRFGRTLMSSGGDFLTWQKGTFYSHWFRHADEMLMCSKLMETDFKLNNNIENSAELVEELCRTDENVSGGGSVLKPGITRDGHKVRLLEQKDNLEDIKLQAYWMSGGDGFEWVEPDQDPAEIIWRNHLDKFKKAGVEGSSAKQLKWTENLIES